MSSEASSFGTGVTLAQLVDASVSQADKCVYCKVQALWAPSGTNHEEKLAIFHSRWLGRYTNMEYLQSLCLKRRGQLLFQV